MVKEIIAEGKTVVFEQDISAFTSVTVISAGGSADTTVQVGKDKDNLVSHTSITGGVGYQLISEDFIYIKITPGTSATVDLVGELR